MNIFLLLTIFIGSFRFDTALAAESQIRAIARKPLRTIEVTELLGTIEYLELMYLAGPTPSFIQTTRALNGLREELHQVKPCQNPSNSTRRLIRRCASPDRLARIANAENIARYRDRWYQALETDEITPAAATSQIASRNHPDQHRQTLQVLLSSLSQRFPIIRRERMILARTECCPQRRF